MSRRTHIGLDRRVDLEWLDAAADLAAAGAATAERRAHLWSLLEGAVSGDKFNSARGKTVTVLHHVWGDVPGPAASLRGRAVAQLEGSTPDDRLALHWAMMVGTYPVFTDSAASVGRLLALQGSFTLAHLTRRLVAVWGERSTLERAGQRIVRSMVQWGALRDTATRGMYEALPRRRKVGPSIAVVLIEALLVDADEASVHLDQLTGHPALFPFDLDLNAGHIRGASQFRVHRQGLDADFVELTGAGRGERVRG
jgi:hypothetical protein